MNTTQTIGVIGAGTMGTGIAQVCAGLHVAILRRADAAAARDAVVTV